MTKEIKYFIITGEPGVGKTTLITKLSHLLNESGVKTAGFITEEIRENKVRRGFDVVTLNGARGRLARDQQLPAAPTKYMVGKYYVFVPEFEKIALQSLNVDKQNDVCVGEIESSKIIIEDYIVSQECETPINKEIPYCNKRKIIESSTINKSRKRNQKRNEIDAECLIIDEIGKMEFFSSLFKNRIKELFDHGSKNFILATIPLRKSDTLIENIRLNKRTKMWTVTRENRNILQGEIFKQIKDCMGVH